MSIDTEKLVFKIKQAMREKGVTQLELARTIGVSHPAISKILTGKTRQSSNIYRMAEALGISYSLLPDDDFSSYSSIEILDESDENLHPAKTGSNIFISYSHRDTEYLHRLQVHLKPLEVTGNISSWADTKILAGDKWKDKISSALDDAKAAILLISADFLASDFIISDELPTLLTKAKEEGTRILPVVLKPCRFSRDIHLGSFQAVNPPNKSVCEMTEAEQEQIYDDVAFRVEQLFSPVPD